MANREPKLPNKLSDVIDVAVADLVAVERQKSKYIVNMGYFHQKMPYDAAMNFIAPEQQKCAVCFAGAVMARTLKTPIDEFSDPDSFNAHNEPRLHALDEIRSGDIGGAFECLGREVPFGLSEQVEVASYDNDPVIFKKDMKKIAKALRVFGE